MLPSGDDVLALKVIVNLQDLIADMKKAGKETATLELLVQHLNEELKELQSGGGGNVRKLVNDFKPVSQEMKRMAEETQKAKAVIRAFADEHGTNLNRAVDAIQRLNDKYIRLNQLIEIAKASVLAKEKSGEPITPQEQRLAGMQPKEILDPKAIRDAKRELLAYQKILNDISKSGQNVWSGMRQFMGLVNKEAINMRMNIEQIKNIINQTRQAGQSLSILEHSFRKANESSKLFTNGEISKAFDEIAAKEKEADRALNDYLKTIQRTGQAWGAQPIEKSTKEMTRSMFSLNDIASTFFGFTISNVAVQAVQKLTGFMREAVVAGNEWSRTLFNLGTAVRALQRTGVEITMAEMNGQIEVLSEKFGFFTERQLQEGISQIALLTRNVGLTKEEIFELSEATATLAIITGKDFAEEGLLVARSIASGYTEALQRAGIAANRLAIVEKAKSMGINKSFLQMTEQERAAVTLALVLDQVAAISEDTALFQQTLAGRMQLTTVAFQEQKDMMGREWFPVMVSIRELFVSWIPAINAVSKVLKAMLVGGISLLGTLGIIATLAFKNLTEGIKFGLDDLVYVFKESFHQLRVSIEENLSEFELPDVGEDQFNIFPPDFLEDDEEEFEDQVNDLKKKIGDILLNFGYDVADAWIELNRKFADIDLDFTRKSEDEWVDYQEDIGKVLRDEQNNLADAQKKYRLAELKAEEDFQEKMLRLREKFLFDLDDALRERDAKQVLRLIKEFNLQSQQMEREKNLEQDQRKRAFDAEIQDIQNQTARKLAELKIEYEQRMKELAIQKQRERDDAQVWYEREIEDAKRQRDRKLEELRAGLDAEYKMLYDAAMAKLELAYFTAEAFNAAWSMLYLLPGSSMGGYLPYPGGGGSGSKQYGDGGGYGAKQYGEGGTMIAKRPTMAIFGERGPEVASFAPLHRIGRDEGKVFGGRLPGGASQSSVSIELLLSSDLEHRIVDASLDATSEVVIRTLRGS